LKGTWFSDEYFALQILPKYCDISIDPNCHTFTELENKIDGQILAIILSHEYLDFNDVENPIKRKFEDRKIRMSWNNYIDYGMYISKNEYNLYDNTFHANSLSKSGEYFSIDEIAQTSEPKRYASPFIMEIKMSSKITEYERHLYTFYDALGNIGGVLGIINIFFTIIAGYFGSKMYHHALLNHMKDIPVSLIINATVFIL